MSLTYDFTADEVIEDGRCERRDVEKIKNWMKSEALPDAPEEQIVLFLLSCDCDVEQAKTTIQSYYHHMNNGKNLTNNRNIHSIELTEQTKLVESAVIPKRTKDNYLVVLQRMKDPSYWNFNLELAMKLLIMTLDLGLMGKPPPDGIVALMDMSTIGIMHLTKLRVGPLRIFFHYLQEALPCQIRAIHVFNAAYFVDKMMAMLKPFMKKELYNKLHFHPPDMNMEEFFENCLEAECVPSDYGGSLPSVEIMSQHTFDDMKKKSDWFAIEENLRKNYIPSSK